MNKKFTKHENRVFKKTKQIWTEAHQQCYENARYGLHSLEVLKVISYEEFKETLGKIQNGINENFKVNLI